MSSFLERREALGMTQRQLADRLGVSPNTVARWERGELPLPRIADRFITILEEQHESKAAAQVP